MKENDHDYSWRCRRPTIALTVIVVTTVVAMSNQRRCDDVHSSHFSLPCFYSRASPLVSLSLLLASLSVLGCYFDRSCRRHPISVYRARRAKQLAARCRRTDERLAATKEFGKSVSSRGGKRESKSQLKIVEIIPTSRTW